MRLDKFIAHSTGAGRKEVKRWLHAEQVTVAGTVVKNSGQKITPEQTVLLNGQPLQYPSPRYLMLNKPPGVVCSNQGGAAPTALDCLTGTDTRDLQIAGRLDKDTTGLVLITDDGQWNHQITAPSGAKDKVYLATLAEPLAPDTAAHFAAGLRLKGESKATRPATLQVIAERQARVTLHEGRYHQVKRMFAACGNHVTALHRESVAGIVLDPALAPGQWRALSPTEVTQALAPANPTNCQNHE
jgi:16S rRNA pseudouridine516 synthase